MSPRQLESQTNFKSGCFDNPVFLSSPGLFRIQSHGPTLVKLKSLKTMKYIAISSTGLVYSTVRHFMPKFSVEMVILRHG